MKVYQSHSSECNIAGGVVLQQLNQFESITCVPGLMVGDE